MVSTFIVIDPPPTAAETARDLVNASVTAGPRADGERVRMRAGTMITTARSPRPRDDVGRQAHPSA
jgi:hypothetical protein